MKRTREIKAVDEVNLAPSYSDELSYGKYVDRNSEDKQIVHVPSKRVSQRPEKRRSRGVAQARRGSCVCGV